MNVRQAEELQSTRQQQQQQQQQHLMMMRGQGVAESDSGCFVASPDQHNMVSGIIDIICCYKQFFFNATLCLNNYQSMNSISYISAKSKLQKFKYLMNFIEY